MKLDALLVKVPLERMSDVATKVESAGFDGLWMTETTNDAFLSLGPAAISTARVTIGTAIALAFVRSPMVTALASWELQRASGGRFVLGLGTQVKAHNERRFSVPFEAPALKQAEQVRALKAVFAAFAGEEKLAFRGDYYRLDLLPPMFKPEPIAHPAPPIWLAAVNPLSYRLAGEVADGVHVHPFHSVRYLREVALPAIEEGLARSGRSRADFLISAQVLVAPGKGEEGRAAQDSVRSQLAFYGSTRTYRAPLDLHGYGDASTRLHDLMATGDIAGMASAVPDELLDDFAVIGDTWEDVAATLRKRYDGVLDRVSLTVLPPWGQAPAAVTAFRGG